MLDEEAGREPEKEEMDKPNLEGLKKKYLWWLTGHQDETSATSPEKVDFDDTVTLFEGKNTRVLTEKTTSPRGVFRTKRTGIVDGVYVNSVM